MVIGVKMNNNTTDNEKLQSMVEDWRELTMEYRQYDTSELCAMATAFEQAANRLEEAIDNE